MDCVPSLKTWCAYALDSPEDKVVALMAEIRKTAEQRLPAEVTVHFGHPQEWWWPCWADDTVKALSHRHCAVRCLLKGDAGTAARTACAYGYDDVLRMVFRRRGKLNDAGLVNFCAARGSLACTQLLYAQGYSFEWLTADVVARRGHFDVLRYIHSIGCEFDIGVMRAAAESGSMRCLAYVTEHCAERGPPVTTMAAQSGSVSCLRYALEHGNPLSDGAMGAAARRGHIACMEFILARGYVLDAWDLEEASEGRREDAVAWLISKGCPMNERVAARSMYSWDAPVRILQMLHEAGCPWDADTTSMAACHRNYDCLVYAVNHGCPVSSSTVAHARINRAEECLAFLHARGFYEDSDPRSPNHAQWRLDNYGPEDEDGSSDSG